MNALAIVALAAAVFGNAANADEARDLPALYLAHVEGLETVKPALLEVYTHVDGFDVWSMKPQNAPAPPADGPRERAALDKLAAAARDAASKFEPFVSSDDAELRALAEDIRGIYQKFEDTNDLCYALLNASYAVHDAVIKTSPTGMPRDGMYERLRALYRVAGDPETRGVLLTEGVHFRNAVVPLYEALLSFSVEDFKAFNPAASEVYRVTGYITDTFVCKPCPPDAICAGCVEEWLAVSDKPDGASELRVYAYGHEIDKLKKWKKYLFNIRLSDRNSYFWRPNESRVELIRAHEAAV